MFYSWKDRLFDWFMGFLVFTGVVVFMLLVISLFAILCRMML